MPGRAQISPFLPVDFKSFCPYKYIIPYISQKCTERPTSSPWHHAESGSPLSLIDLQGRETDTEEDDGQPDVDELDEECEEEVEFVHVVSLAGNTIIPC